jgi:capsular polysaccharide export protein
MLLNTYEVSEDEKKRGEKLLATMLENKISKYNNAKHVNFDGFYGEKTKHRVLVIGQVQKDMSLKYGCSRKVTNNDLVRIARRENPNSEVFYKIHPDVLGKDADNPKDVEDICTILEEPMSAHSVLENMDKVYTITSLMGMESLLRGKEVVCIGAPFYSNWGLTDDRQMVIRRRRNRTLMELFVISYIVYPEYMDVHSKRLSTPENTLKNLVSDYKKIVMEGEEDSTLNKVSLTTYLKHFCIKNIRKIKMKLG